MNIFAAVHALCDYAVNEKLICKEDYTFIRNRVLEALSLDSYEDETYEGNPSLQEILASILDYACNTGICENSVVYRDLFDTKIMGILTPRPSQVIGEFFKKYSEARDTSFETKR